MNKNKARLRRAKKTRAKIATLGVHRLSVYRSNKNIHVQVYSPCGSKVIACASTVEKDVKSKLKAGCNKEAAKLIGNLIAERVKDKGINQIAFDRSGYKYHGRVKALADAVREGGIEF